MAGSAKASDSQDERWAAIADGIAFPAVAASGDRGLIAFARDRSGDLVVLARAGEGWHEPLSLGAMGPLAQWPVAVCSAGDGDLHLLSRGPDGELLHARA